MADKNKFTNVKTALKTAEERSRASKEAFHVIKDLPSKTYYVDTDGLIRNFEKLIAIYEDGKKIH